MSQIEDFALDLARNGKVVYISSNLQSAGYLRHIYRYFKLNWSVFHIEDSINYVQTKNDSLNILKLATSV